MSESQIKVTLQHTSPDYKKGFMAALRFIRMYAHSNQNKRMRELKKLIDDTITLNSLIEKPQQNNSIMGEWISLKEKTPPEGRLLLICFEIAFPEIDVGVFSGGEFYKKNQSLTGQFDFLFSKTVSHWILLEYPPRMVTLNFKVE